MDYLIREVRGSKKNEADHFCSKGYKECVDIVYDYGQKKEKHNGDK